MTIGQWPGSEEPPPGAGATLAPPELLSLHWQLERRERLAGMRSLDAVEINYHFSRARALREQAERVTERLSRIDMGHGRVVLAPDP